MKGSMKNFLMLGLWTSIVLYAIRCFISMPEGMYDIFCYAGEAIGVAVILLGLYEKLLWQFNPLDKTPRVKGAYNGIIEYNYNGKTEKKKSSITIKQSLLTITVRITTNEITSSTITSCLLEENGEHVLYYTYITYPKSKYSQENPVQYGTCRIPINGKGDLQGTYWTSRKTTGDIFIKRS